MRPGNERAATSRSDSPQHPLDLPLARRYFLGAVVLATLTAPVSIVSMMLALWAVSDNLVTPVLGSFLGLVVMAYVERRYRSDAWAYIPRRRQDLGRDEPGALAVVTASAQVVWLVAATALVHDAHRPDVASLAVGSLLGLICCLVLILAWDLRAPVDRRVLFVAPTIEVGFVTAVFLVAGYRVVALAGGGTDVAELVVGATLALAITAVGLCFRLIPRQVACLPSGFSAE